MMKLAYLACIVLHHRLPEAHLPIACDDDFSAVANGQYGRTVHHIFNRAEVLRLLEQLKRLERLEPGKGNRSSRSKSSNRSSRRSGLPQCFMLSDEPYRRPLLVDPSSNGYNAGWSTGSRVPAVPV